MGWTWALITYTCLAFFLAYLVPARRVRSVLIQLIAYALSISPPTALYHSILDLDALTTRYHAVISELDHLRRNRTTNLSHITGVLEDRHQSEVAHLRRSIAQLTELLDESREREARQKRRVQRKVGQERKLTSALGEQLTLAHASSAQARQRVFEISGVCSRVQGSNARLKAENDELRMVGGEVLDDNERLLSELHRTQREAARYREEVARLEGELESQESSARSVEANLRDQLERLKGSFASLEDIVDDARAELSECKDELSELKTRLAQLPEAYDGDVSDLELEKTLFEAEAFSESDASSCAGGTNLPRAKLESECLESTVDFVALSGAIKQSEEFRSMLERLRSLLPSTVTVRVVAIPPPSTSSLAALDLAYSSAAVQLSYEDLLALDFPSFSSLSSLDGDTCVPVSFPHKEPPAKSLFDEALSLPSDIYESQPSSSTSAPSLPLFAASDKVLDPFDADPMLAIPKFRLTHSAPPSPRRSTCYARDLEYLCLQKSTSLPRAIDELAPGPLPRSEEKLLDVKMPRTREMASSKPIRAHTRACTAPLTSSSSSSSTTSLPLFSSNNTPPDPFGIDPMLAVPLFRLTSSAPPTPKKLSRSDLHLERIAMRASTSLPEPIDEILPGYDVDVRNMKARVWEEMIWDEKVPWDGFMMSDSPDEFDTAGVPPIPRSAARGGMQQT